VWKTVESVDKYSKFTLFSPKLSSKSNIYVENLVENVINGLSIAPALLYENLYDVEKFSVLWYTVSYQ
jgi:hypothetical protein